jgi:hypothetical protein
MRYCSFVRLPFFSQARAVQIVGRSRVPTRSFTEDDAILPRLRGNQTLSIYDPSYHSNRSHRCLIWIGTTLRYRWPSQSDYHSSEITSGASTTSPNYPAQEDAKPVIQSGSGKVEGLNSQNGGTRTQGEAQQTKATSNTENTGKPIQATSMSLDPSRVALLLETRPLPHLPALLAHFISVLPPPWVFRFVGSQEANALITASSLAFHIKSGKLVVDELPSKYDIKSQESISTTLTDLAFYKDFLAPAEWLLMFQSDSIICAASEKSIEDFVSANYSWVGAPWNMEVKGGNGGFSLRHVPSILKILEKETRAPGSVWEDRWLCDRLVTMDGANMPGPGVEVQFSVESQWTEKPLGYHLIGSGKLMVEDIWGNATRRQHIMEYCPEVKIILDMELLSQVKKLEEEVKALKEKDKKD